MMPNGKVFLLAIILGFSALAFAPDAPAISVERQYWNTSQTYAARRQRVKQHRQQLGKIRSYANSNELVRSRNGRTARVSPKARANFQCLVDKLESQGYRIEFMGGYGSRAFRQSKHPLGQALDINQTARNRVTQRLPANTNAIARSCGLLHGAEWQQADGGHFETLPRYADRSKIWPIASIEQKRPVQALVPLPPSRVATIIPLPPVRPPLPGDIGIEADWLDMDAKFASLPPQPVTVVTSLDPIRPEDAKNVFARFEQSLFRVVGRCRDFEALDWKVRQIVADSVRHFNAGPALLSSCYRDAVHNRRVGGARLSQHRNKKAIDYKIAGVDKQALFNWVKRHKYIGGVGIYKSGAIHVDVRPRKAGFVVSWDWRAGKKWAKKRWASFKKKWRGKRRAA